MDKVTAVRKRLNREQWKLPFNKRAVSNESIGIILISVLWQTP